MPKVSIVIPTYNRAEFIAQAVHSALDQEGLDLEVVVVDDGSTDQTGSIIRQIDDPRLHYIYQNNQGKGSAINQGVSQSRGYYICKLDSDDFLVGQGLLKLATMLDQDMTLGVSAGGYRMIDQQGNLLQEMHPWESRPDLDLKTWIKGCPILWQGALIRRNWFETVGGFNTQLFGPDDWDFGIRLALVGCRMSWVHTMIFSYRIHPGMSVNQVQRFNREALGILDHYFSLPNLHPLIEDYKIDAYRQAYINNAGRAYAASMFEEGQKNLSAAIQLDPDMIAKHGKKLFFTIAWLALSPLITRQPVQFIHSVIDHLPEETLQFRNSYHMALAEMYAVQFYLAYNKGKWTEVRRLGYKILVNDPSRIFDRGVWSTLIKSFKHSTSTSNRLI